MMANKPLTPSAAPAVAPSLAAHVQIARPDHWVKNVFVLPGAVVAISIDKTLIGQLSIGSLLAGVVAICLITSSNYVLNELLDARYDRLHPTKRFRPVPSGRVSIPLAYAQWILLILAGMALSWWVSAPFALCQLGLWLMGCAYNVPPIRTKDIPYIDVLSEAVNNPLRMLLGWYITGTEYVPPFSLLLSYWMVGAYFMAIKRFAEYRSMGNPSLSGSYRRSFIYYNERRLLVFVVLCCSLSMLFLGAFIMRYRLELLLSFPLVALVMALYFSMAFRPEGSAEHPEKLYRERSLMIAVIACAAVMTLLLFVDLEFMHRWFLPRWLPETAVYDLSP